jgi:hypothetical protein
MNYSIELNVELDGDTDYIIHFHLSKCPTCSIINAPTDYYSSPLDCIEDGGEFSCCKCGSKFKLISFDDCEEPNAIIEDISV